MHESLFETIRKVLLVPPHPAGWPFIGGGVVAALLLSLLSSGLGMLALLLTAFCLYFFRNPDRITPQREGLVVAAADGTLSRITPDISLPPELGEGEEKRYTRVSTFLSVLDVHVQRFPVSGRIVKKVYTPGKFLNADLDKASEDNERCTLLIETESGAKVAVVQIAGLIARRILNEAQEGGMAQVGARFGLIRFGSRVDVYLPMGTAPLVCAGQKMTGGETVLADFASTESQRTGQVN